MFGTDAVDIHAPIGCDERDSLIDSLAEKVVARRLETPAVLFLEMHKPLSFLASQTMLVAMPFLAPLIGGQRVADMSKLLQKRENIELLITRIETMAQDSKQ